MDKEYYNEMRQTALDVKAELTHHIKNLGKPPVTEDVSVLDAVSSIADVAEKMAHRAACGYLPQHTDDLYWSLINAASNCIVAANKVRNG